MGGAAMKGLAFFLVLFVLVPEESSGQGNSNCYCINPLQGTLDDKRGDPSLTCNYRVIKNQRYCYVNSRTSCNDSKRSKRYSGKWWSKSACDNNEEVVAAVDHSLCLHVNVLTHSHNILIGIVMGNLTE